MRMFTCVPGGLPCCEMEKVLEFDLPVLEAIDKRRVALQRTHVHSLLRITRIDRRHNQMHLAGEQGVQGFSKTVSGQPSHRRAQWTFQLTQAEGDMSKALTKSNKFHGESGSMAN
eukprot:1786253-Pyramimonas_sp.AAC.1